MYYVGIYHVSIFACILLALYYERRKKSVRPFCDRSCNTRAILSVRKLFTHCAYRSEQNRYFTIYKLDMLRGRSTQSCMILDASSHPIGSCTVWRYDKYIHSFTFARQWSIACIYNPSGDRWGLRKIISKGGD